MTEEPRRIHRTLTQKYDMNALKKLQTFEDIVLKELAEIYSCDEDDVPVNLDLLDIYHKSVDNRQNELTILFGNAPSNKSNEINGLIHRILAEMSATHILPSGIKSVPKANEED